MLQTRETRIRALPQIDGGPLTQSRAAHVKVGAIYSKPHREYILSLLFRLTPLGYFRRFRWLVIYYPYTFGFTAKLFVVHYMRTNHTAHWSKG